MIESARSLIATCRAQGLGDEDTARMVDDLIAEEIDRRLAAADCTANLRIKEAEDIYASVIAGLNARLARYNAALLLSIDDPEQRSRKAGGTVDFRG